MYGTVVQEHFDNPRNMGTLADADYIGTSGTRGRGNYLVLYVKVTEGNITSARFQTYGCPAAIAAGSWLAEWVVNKATAQLAELTSAMVDQGLGGLPLGKEHCAFLPVEAARSIVAQAGANLKLNDKSQLD